MQQVIFYTRNCKSCDKLPCTLAQASVWETRLICKSLLCLQNITALLFEVAYLLFRYFVTHFIRFVTRIVVVWLRKKKRVNSWNLQTNWYLPLTLLSYKLNQLSYLFWIKYLLNSRERATPCSTKTYIKCLLTLI